MTNILTNPWTLILLIAFVAVVVATARTIRNDRPTAPPGAPRDWRNDQLQWNLLQFR